MNCLHSEQVCFNVNVVYFNTGTGRLSFLKMLRSFEKMTSKRFIFVGLREGLDLPGPILSQNPFFKV